MLKISTKMMLALGLLSTTCSGVGPSAQTAAPEPRNQTAEPAAKAEEGKMTLTGTLAETVEAGGWVLNTEKKMYLLLFDQKYRKEPWFRAGAKVKVVGEESPDAITIFMQGAPFKVEKMEPAGEDK